MTHINLSEFDWKLEGWRPFSWRLGRSQETDTPMQAEFGPVAAAVPGSVQGALRGAGLLPDWNQGLNSLACEWVEHRHWIFETILPESLFDEPRPWMLEAEGLDYSGWILIDDQEIGHFEGALTPHRFDLSDALAEKKPHRIALVFDLPPEEQGQIGYTSASRFFKPRYNFSWDWAPRFVPIGISGPLRLSTGPEALMRLAACYTTLSEDLKEGAVHVRVEAGASAATLRVTVMDGEHPVAEAVSAVEEGRGALVCPVDRPRLWQPNGQGKAQCYVCQLEALDAQGAVLWRRKRTMGFRHIAWRACEGAPEDAAPWICVVNGEAVFLQGVNWTPLRVDYPATTEAEYDRLIGLYQEMGVNLLRVWGGAYLESEYFYEQCDAAGILVWQEFPLSSSGIENTPPEASEAFYRLKGIAASYIERRMHHPSLAIWCGGNELTGPPPEIRPITESHPCIAMLKELVEKRDPTRRFLPTSSSGPSFYAHKENYGKGLHHDVHGPWGITVSGEGLEADLEEWQAYWAADDSLFRSEVGVPGAASVASIRKWAGTESWWPPTARWWRHSSAWWLQWDRFKEACSVSDAEAALARYVAQSQVLQAEGYAIAAAAAKARFPRCGGFLIWMGHDAFPCPSNNALIDFERQPKPAWYALQDIFREGPPS